MTAQVLRIFHQGDVYEVTLRSVTIIRIVRFLGNSDFPRELSFDDCRQDVQDLILDTVYHTILGREQEEDETPERTIQ